MKKTTVLNLLGGPGIGKSTSAALMYAHLKSQGVSCELVREYVKEHAWEGRQLGPYDQLHVTGEQIRRETLLFGKTNIVITDSPVLVGVEYARRYSPKHVAKGVLEAVRAFYKQAQADGHEHLHIFLQRSKPYKPEGRYQTEEEARKIDNGMRELLDALGYPYIYGLMPVQGNLEALADATVRFNATVNRRVMELVTLERSGKQLTQNFLAQLVSTFSEPFLDKNETRCFICNQISDGQVNGIPVFECGHPQAVGT